MALPTQAWSDVDFTRDGKQFDHVFIPHSVNRSAYGHVAVPIVTIKNGPGPTILLTAGNHGDEFEGQLVAGRLARKLDSPDVRGLLIVIPGLNFPAAISGSRVSPIDAGNLNRSFPGNPKGTPTEQLAYYLHTVLMPMADVVIDLHSGGSSLDYLPTTFMNISGKRAIDDGALEAMRVFGAPLCMVFREDGGDARRAFSSAHQNECIYIATELGGTGSVNVDNLAFSYAGTVRLLTHFGLLRSDKALLPIRRAEHSRFVQIPNRDYQLHATAGGIFEPHFKLGDEVKTGDLAGLTYSQHLPTSEAVPSYFRANGFVICRRHPALVEAGDCIAHVATDFDTSLL
jgi:predicted deacylase